MNSRNVQICRRIRARETFSSIARDFAVSPQRIQQIASENGLGGFYLKRCYAERSKAFALWRDGWSVPEISEKLGIGRATARLAVEERGERASRRPRKVPVRHRYRPPGPHTGLSFVVADITPDWPKDRLESLVRIWNAGKSASEIAAHLGRRATRNSVIGKIQRMRARG